MTERKSADIERRARQHYLDQADSLDIDTVSALRAARSKALEQARKGRRVGPLVPVGAVAAGAGAVVLAWWVLGNDPDGPELAVATQPEDMEILLAGEELALLEELEFYLWLETEPDAG